MNKSLYRIGGCLLYCSVNLWLSLTLCEEESLEVVPQRDGDDGEVGRQGEHGKQAQEVVDPRQVPGL